jgi:hypothetical protein
VLDADVVASDRVELLLLRPRGPLLLTLAPLARLVGVPRPATRPETEADPAVAGGVFPDRDAI